MVKEKKSKLLRGKLTKKYTRVIDMTKETSEASEVSEVSKLSEKDIVKLLRITSQLIAQNKRLKEENTELKNYLKSLTGLIFTNEDNH